MLDEDVTTISEVADRLEEIADGLIGIANEELLKQSASSPPIGNHDAPVHLSKRPEMKDSLAP